MSCRLFGALVALLILIPASASAQTITNPPAPTLTLPQVINLSGVAPPPVLSQSVLQLVGGAGQNARLYLDGYGANPMFTMLRANGTPSAPTAILSGNLLSGIAAGGYGATTWGGGRAAINFNAIENWTDAAQGTSLSFNTTTAGTTTSTARWTMSGDGHLIPNVSSTYDIGSAGVRVRKVYTDGLAVTGTSLFTDSVTVMANSANAIGIAIQGRSSDSVANIDFFNNGATVNTGNLSFSGDSSGALQGLSGATILSWDTSRNVSVPGTFTTTGRILGTNVLAGGANIIGWNARTNLTAPSDGQMTVANNAGTNVFTLTASGSGLASLSTALSISSANGVYLANGTNIADTANGTLVLRDNINSVNATLALGASHLVTFQGPITAGGSVLGTNFITTTGAFFFTGKGSISAPSDGVFNLSDSTGASFSRLELGGTTSSFPAIKRNSTTLEIKLADDSAFTALGVGNFYLNNTALVQSPGAGIVTLYNVGGTDFSRLQLGGTTSGFPSIKRSGTALLFRLADDSGDAPITAGNAGFAAVTASSLKVTPTTVAGLITCNLGNDGLRQFVTDATVAVFATAAVGSGTNHVPVYCDGSGTPAWKIG